MTACTEYYAKHSEVLYSFQSSSVSNEQTGQEKTFHYIVRVIKIQYINWFKKKKEKLHTNENICKMFQVMTLISEKQKPESKYTLGYLICILFSDNWLKRIATKGKKYI